MTQLPLGLYGRLNFFVSPVPLPGQLALAPETPLLAPKDRDLAPKSYIAYSGLNILAARNNWKKGEIKRLTLIAN